MWNNLCCSPLGYTQLSTAGGSGKSHYCDSCGFCRLLPSMLTDVKCIIPVTKSHQPPNTNRKKPTSPWLHVHNSVTHDLVRKSKDCCYNADRMSSCCWSDLVLLKVCVTDLLFPCAPRFCSPSFFLSLLFLPLVLSSLMACSQVSYWKSCQWHHPPHHQQLPQKPVAPPVWAALKAEFFLFHSTTLSTIVKHKLLSGTRSINNELYWRRFILCMQNTLCSAAFLKKWGYVVYIFNNIYKGWRSPQCASPLVFQSDS